MSIFTETMTKAISDYRLLLRRHLGQVERMVKLQKLNLRNGDIYASDLSLYKIGKLIVADIEENMTTPNQSYYAYSGIQQFCRYLKEYLDGYHIEKNEVVHRGQKASRALLEAIQLSGLPREQLTDTTAKQLIDCNKCVAGFGSQEQCDLQLQILSRQQANNPGFFTRIIAHMESLISSRCSEAA